MNNVLDQSIFRQLMSDYQQSDMQCKLIAPTDTIPFETLVILFDEIGDQLQAIRLECNFFPESDADSDVMLLQSFAVLTDRAIAYHQPELLRLLAVINHTLPLGAFGLIELSNVVYYKHNTMLMKALGLEKAVRQIDAQNGLILHVHQLYFDAIHAVAHGEKSCEEALSDLGMDSLNLKAFK